MTQRKNIVQIIFFVLIVLSIVDNTVDAQTRMQPKWWFGGAIGPNINFYSSSLSQLNANTLAPVSFTKGSGVGVYLSPLLEYRPDPVWGGMLMLGFDGRNGGFDDVSSGGTNYELFTSMNYISLEPSVRATPFESGLYFFAGPRLAFNVAKTFTYTPQGSSKVQSEWSDTRGTVLSAQIGVGYDIPFTSIEAVGQMYVSPFLALHFGQGPRTAESWTITTVRAGVAVKFGSSTLFGITESGKQIQYSVAAPAIIPNERKVKETFPLRNDIFFDEGPAAIPSRYVQLSKENAASFREENLVQPEPNDLTSRSRRQMTVYHNILNILGDRMRTNLQSTITLSGSSDNGSAEGKALAEAVKDYLVEVFGVDEKRILVEGRDKPAIPSALPGGTHELELVRPEDRRVEVNSSDPQLLDPVKIISLQDEPLDSDVLVNVGGAGELLDSWTVDITDDAGNVQHYGPFTAEQERIAGKRIIGDKLRGTYTVTLLGQMKNGQTVRDEKTISLVRSNEPEEEPGLRFSILFEFDQSKTVATYERFLAGTVAPLIPSGGSVTIHGHTDIVGEESHNLTLSKDRAEETRKIFERELAKSGKRNVKFDAYGFGEDPRRAPFDNRLPEERFYNRTVIIDIIPR